MWMVSVLGSLISGSAVFVDVTYFWMVGDVRLYLVSDGLDCSISFCGGMRQCVKSMMCV